MKEPDYVMQIMATGGSLCTMGGKEVRRIWRDGDSERTTTFQYAKPFEWHFRYCHAVDDHNNLHHAIPSIEGTGSRIVGQSVSFPFCLLLLSPESFYLQ